MSYGQCAGALCILYLFRELRELLLVLQRVLPHELPRELLRVLLLMFLRELLRESYARWRTGR